MVPEHKPVLPSGVFLRMATTGDLFKVPHCVPLTILAVTDSVRSNALHLPALSASPSLPHDASKKMQMAVKKRRMVAVLSFFIIF